MRLLRQWLSWAFFPMCLLAPPLLGIYGAVSPWSTAETALSAQAGRTKLLVGISYRGGSTLEGSYERKARTYVFFPEGFNTFESVSVIQENGKVRTEFQRLGFVIPLFAFALGLIGTLWQVYRFSSKRSLVSAR